MSDLSVSSLGASDGFKYVGHVASYAALQQEVPSYAGQHILLEAYYDGWAAQFKPAKGGGEFVAISGNASDDGGSICHVNDSWYWLRLTDSAYSPEMFGAYGDGSTDDAAAIAAAMQAARSSAVSSSAANGYVRGDGVYLVGSTIEIAPTYLTSPSGGTPAVGFRLELARVIADYTVWDDVPTDWWNATPVFKPTGGAENFDIRVDQFDGGGKATFFNTSGASLSTSSIFVGYARNYVLMFKNYRDAIAQGGMNRISGNNWQSGYMGVLLGASPSAISECHEIDVKWCANHRYQAVSLQDHSNYANVLAGTYDYNGRWSSCLTLSGLSSSESADVEFGDTVTIGSVTGTALSSLMNWKGEWVLMMTESADKTDGTSDYTVGSTATVGSWSATVESIALCSTTSILYFDMVLSCRAGDFDKSTIMPTYLGGWRGHNAFTNVVISPNSYDTVDAVNLRGLGIAGGEANLSLYIAHLYNNDPILQFAQDSITVGESLVMGNNPVYGSKIHFTAYIGAPAIISTLPAAESDDYPAYYSVFIGSSVPAQYAKAIVCVNTTTVTIVESTLSYFTLDVDGFNLQASINGSNANVTVTVSRIL